MSAADENERAPLDKLRDQLGQALERDLTRLRENSDAAEAARGPLSPLELAQRAQALALALCSLELCRIADLLELEAAERADVRDLGGG